MQDRSPKTISAPTNLQHCGVQACKKSLDIAVRRREAKLGTRSLARPQQVILAACGVAGADAVFRNTPLKIVKTR
jgi:hypothetical protein